MSIESAQVKVGYPTSTSFENGLLKEIDFDKFRSRERYHLCRDVYWCRYTDMGEDHKPKYTYSHVAKRFNLPEDEVTEMCKDFKKYLHNPVHIYDREE